MAETMAYCAFLTVTANRNAIYISYCITEELPLLHKYVRMVKGIVYSVKSHYVKGLVRAQLLD